MKPLEVIGHINVPPAVMKHRFVREAMACTLVVAESEDPRAQVVGTANTKKVELYGWAQHVDSHVDNTGWVYFVALNDGRSTVNAWGVDNEPISIWLPRGAVVRLNDYVEHWTEDDRPRVCAFIGSYRTPHDYDAMVALRAGIDMLDRGDYYGAPRVRDGFRALQPDECIAATPDFDDFEIMLVEDARAQGRYVETCAQCTNFAVKLDQHWPYHTDMNRCREHLKGNS